MDKNDIWHHFAMPENGTHPKLFILNTKTMNRWMFLAFSKVEVPTTFGLDFQMDLAFQPPKTRSRGESPHL